MVGLGQSQVWLLSPLTGLLLFQDQGRVHGQPAGDAGGGGLSSTAEFC